MIGWIAIIGVAVAFVALLVGLMMAFAKDEGNDDWKKTVGYGLAFLLLFVLFFILGEALVAKGVLDYCSGYNEADPNHCHEVP